MEIYPAIRAKMGSDDEGWTYYIVKMNMQSIASNINFVDQFGLPGSTTDILQRSRSEKRILDQIVPYLQRRPDRFFSAIICASLGGEATFQPVQFEKKGEPLWDKQLEEMEKTFGMLSFDGDNKYYALDGQHRLGAIKEIIFGEEEFPRDSGDSFRKEEMTVVILRNDGAEDDEAQWRRSFRRVFTSLNRYTKSTNADTNILMDDDDIIAIATRSLIEDFSRFQWDGVDVMGNPVICLEGNNLKENNTHITTLQTLYSMNETLALSIHDNEWNGIPGLKLKKQNRPEESEIDQVTNELFTIWESLFTAVPELSKEALYMRTNDPEVVQDGDSPNECNIFFRPVFQQHILAVLLQVLIAQKDLKIDKKILSKEFQVINKLPSSMFSPPWRNLLLIENEQGKWIIRGGSEGKEARNLALNIAMWLCDLYDLDEEEIKDLEILWKSFMSSVTNTEKDAMWKEVLKIKG